MQQGEQTGPDGVFPMDGAGLLGSLTGALRTITLAPGDVLVREGSASDDVFVVLSGGLDAVTGSDDTEVVVNRVGPGAIVGEISVIAGGRRTATLRASGPTEVTAVSRRDFERWLADHPAAADSVANEARRRIDRGRAAAIMTELVGPDEPAVVEALVERVTWCHLNAGDTLFVEGDPSDAAYLVISGRLLATATDRTGHDQALTELGRGQVVGELGLLDPAPRSATVRAVRDTTLARLGIDVFNEHVVTSPALLLHVTRGLLARLRQPTRLLVQTRAVAVAITAPGAGPELVPAMLEAMGRFGSVEHLTSARVDALLGRDGIAQVGPGEVGDPRVSELLHELDAAHDVVVLETDTEPGGWTARAVRHAERTVIVCSSEPDGAEANRIRGLLADLDGLAHVRTMLAVLRPAGAPRPLNTAELLNRFNVDEVVHVRADDGADVARLGRLASGNGVGLVLSGGGARGFAHLGVYRALQEAGVPVDAICGTSIGSVMAGGIATGMPAGDLVPTAERLFHRLMDYTVPAVALLRGRRISANIEEAFGQWDIEDLVLPYYCVSTNLTRSQPEIHRRGPADRAIRASVAIPGVLPPIPQGEDLLVDGGVLDNMPFGPMAADARIGTVIAVDVAPARGPRARGEFGPSVSGLQVLAGRLRRSRSPYPGISAVLLRSMLAGAVRNQRSALADGTVDLLLHLDLPGVGLLEFDRVAEVEEAGYHASRDEVRAWAVAAGWATT